MNYSITYPLSPTDFDAQGILNPYTLLKCMEDIAVKNASSLQFGVAEVLSKNVAWVLLKYRIEFNDYPQNIEQLIIHTEPRGLNRLFAFRDFILRDEAGRQLGRASSTWTVIDMESKAMLSPMQVFGDCMPVFEKREDDLKYQKIRPLATDSAVLESGYSVQESDIDLNQHVNNCSYINWTFGTLDEGFSLGKKLKTLDINFKKEVFRHESVISQAQASELSSTHRIIHAKTGDELFLMSAQWTPTEA